MPRPMTRRPLDEPEALRALLLFLSCDLLLLLELRDPLLRFGMLILG